MYCINFLNKYCLNQGNKQTKKQKKKQKKKKKNASSHQNLAFFFFFFFFFFFWQVRIQKIKLFNYYTEMDKKYLDKIVIIRTGTYL